VLVKKVYSYCKEHVVSRVERIIKRDYIRFMFIIVRDIYFKII
jgi:hypothetical protein